MISLEFYKLISPKTVSFELIPGGNPELTAEMLAGAMAYADISDEASLYCHYKLCLDENPRTRARLEYLMLKQVDDKILNSSWSSVKAEFIPIMVKVALDECMFGAICRTCGGKGEILVKNKVTPCDPCGSSGLRTFSKRETARRLGIDHRNYSRRYESKYKQVLCLFYELESELASVKSKI